MTAPLVFPADEWDLVKRLHRLLLGDDQALGCPPDEALAAMISSQSPGGRSNAALPARVEPGPLT